jgi:membrane-bound serine protease (ClpP class)
VVGSGAGIIIGAVAISKYLGTVPFLNRLTLQPPVVEVSPARIEDTHERFGVQVGDRGRADSPLRPAGRVKIGDQYLDVVADGSFVEAGTEVKIVRISGNRIVVRATEEPSNA